MRLLNDLRPSQAGFQAFRTHRFEQVIDGVRFKRLQGMFIVSRRKYHRRRRFQDGHVPRCLKPVHDRHTNVEQHHVRFFPLGDFQGFQAVLCFQQDVIPVYSEQDVFQPVARRFFVINDQNFHG